MAAAPFRAEFVKSAKKEFDHLPSTVQGGILEALHLLCSNPFSELLRIKKLKGPADLYRVRLGDYRLVYEVRREAFVLAVIKVGHRSDVYRRL